MRIHIEAVKFTVDQKLTDYIQKKLSKLDQFFDRIVDVSVFLKLENSGQVKDKIVEVRVNVPGDTLICKHTDKLFEASIDAVSDNLKRQLIRFKEKRMQQRA
jgi:putative sigma-54 modulation protein